ncbi:MAG TPA: hypothetical protein PLS69_13550, partial [Terricaulis sp.]|nr:hypothetical protein [Terricaulis sp.]
MDGHFIDAACLRVVAALGFAYGLDTPTLGLVIAALFLAPTVHVEPAAAAAATAAATAAAARRDGLS